MSRNETEARQAGVRRTVWRTVAALVGMFAFAFALVPMYDAFCRLTGINGKVDTTARAIVNEEVDESRMVTVQFITRNGTGLPWRMEAETRQVRLHPGQTSEVNFIFRNQSDAESWGRAVPSVSPSSATRHVRKTSCFCFEEQQLQAGERIELPLVFQLARDLPPEVHTVTLVYTLYPVEGKQEPLQVAVQTKQGEEA
ncbi:cytochrome c oxidase assembly protein [Halomonas sp. MCCC 1A17488]|uniref:Cytochrome c oxidase assembly protein CtaG n=1 Tax=Billgrantia sulfidoxydans TaxID=2733484 RepID=A0ABX7W633_9GAMM|nr:MULTISPECIES: cytochrome c oxidase assembly protein [Halomonas]MCE8015021.1 cytochrome c oxidase assembly protein [Halomonas sp. MCCC 1A17488]MCG3238354.1 cytochrome c oxidase assembly protein [Halomonas sp. MCCC 1A17488]QPP47897.1 cytochrome c oxidase assembly protein [Halomonas sp. SS10-MC5]QTP55200.1 cytochrome c oxidase assembly protein [Halomonas sulfidoxydans]